MKAEQVIITKTPKEELEPGWHPNEAKLPDIVKLYMDEYLSPRQFKHRMDIVRKTIFDMVHHGQAVEKTVILALSGKEKGEIINKPFTFYKIVNQDGNRLIDG